MSFLDKIFGCRLKGIELNIFRGDIVMAETDAIAILCDRDLKLNAGVGKAVKTAGGQNFTHSLNAEKRKQRGARVIAVPIACAIRSSYVLLAPVSGADRHSFDQIYVAIIQKAFDLRIGSLSLPLLGSGAFLMPFEESSNFMWTGLEQFSSFGRLKKIQFIDTNDYHMRSLHQFVISKLRSHNHRKTEQSSGESVSSVSTADERGGDSDDDDDENSDVDVSSVDEDMDSNDSDSNDSVDSDDDIFTQELDDATMDSDSNEEEQSDNNASERHSALIKEQEKQFWTVVPVEQLRNDAGLSQTSDKPSTSLATTPPSSLGGSQIKRLLRSQNNSQVSSSSSMRHPNVCLDDSSIPCSICLNDMCEDCDDVVVQLSLCSHLYHKNCIKSAFAVKRQCPLCMLWYGDCVGYQPSNATMTVRQTPGYVPGHRNAKGFHEITYHVPAGIQTRGHIRPGQPYSSTTRVAYLPNNAAGTHVLKLLQLAFTRRLVFTIGDSVTTGRKNVPVWNGIHHKTNKKGGPQGYGYPDPAYLERVKEELSLVGVISEQLG